MCTVYLLNQQVVTVIWYWYREVVPGEIYMCSLPPACYLCESLNLYRAPHTCRFKSFEGEIMGIQYTCLVVMFFGVNVIDNYSCQVYTMPRGVKCSNQQFNKCTVIMFPF